MAVDFPTLLNTFYPAGPNSIYVATTGNDGNPGTAGSPKQTINGALAAIGSGGKIFVANGNYGEVSISGKNFTPTSYCHIIAQNLWGAKISSAGGRAVSIQNSSYVAIYGFEIQGMDDASHQWQDCIGSLGNIHHITAWRNHCHDGSHGIAVAGNLGPANNVDISYNVVHDCGKYLPSAASGISLFEFWNTIGSSAGDAYGYANYVVGNVCYHNYNIAASSDGNGIIIDDMQNTQSWGGPTGVPYTGRWGVWGNLCVDNGGRGVHMFQSDHGDEYFNTVAHNMWAQPDTNQAELSAVYANDIRMKWNCAKVNTANGGRTKWLDNYGSSIATDANVFLAGINQGTASRDRSTVGLNYFKSNTPSMAPISAALIDDWRPDGGGGAIETVVVDTTTYAAMSRWPDWFGDYRPARTNGWALGFCEATAGGGVAPTADFSLSDTTPSTGQSITFTDLSTGAPTSWLWDFDDAASAVELTEAWTDSNGAAWNSGRWTTSFAGASGTISIQGNKGRMLTGATGGYADIARALATTADIANVDVLVSLTIGDTTYHEEYPSLFLRGDGGWAGGAAAGEAANECPNTCYDFKIEPNSDGSACSFYIRKWVSGVVTTISSVYTLPSYTRGTAINIRAQCNGTTIQGKCWQGGSEPGSWNLSVTDSAVTTGKVQMSLVQGAAAYAVFCDWDDMTITNLSAGATSTAQNPTHTWTTGGTKNVSLTATNANGSNTKTVAYSVAGPVAPVANFSMNPPAPQYGDVVQFTDLSTNNPTSWAWQFGDSATSTAQNPTHSYTDPGGGTPVDATNVVSLGITVNSGADQATAIQNMVNNRAVDAAIFFPAGTYRLSSRLILTKGIKILGPGELIFTTPANMGVYIDGAGGVVLDGLKITGQATVRLTNREATGICSYYGYDTVVQNCLVQNSASAGIYFEGAGNFLIKNNTVQNTKSDAIHMTGGATHGIIEGNTVINPGDDMMAVVTYGGQTLCQWIKYINNTVSGGNARGASVVGGYEISYLNNHITGSRAAGIYLASEPSYDTEATQKVRIDGNTLTDCNWDAAVNHGGIFIWGGKSDKPVDDITVNNNHIDGTIQGGAHIVVQSANESRIKFTANATTGTKTHRYIEADTAQWKETTGTHNGSAVADGGTYAGTPTLPATAWESSVPTFTGTEVSGPTTYSVTLTATNGTGSDPETKSLTVTPAGTVNLPVAAFSINATTGAPGDTFTFTNTSTGASSYSWAFGDGATSTATNPTHAFTVAGTYTITLTAINANGNTQVTHTVTITGTPPAGTAAYEAEVSLLGVAAGAPGGVVAPTVNIDNPGFLGSGYLGYYGDPGQFNSWETGNTPIVISATGLYRLTFRYQKGDTGTAIRDLYIDGTKVATLNFPQTGADWNLNTWQTVIYDVNWASTGNKAVKLQIPVTEAMSVNYADFDRVDVTPLTLAAPPQADFTVSNANPIIGEAVIFTNTSTGGPVSFAWEFGDGATASGAGPVTHGYGGAGTYAAKLTVSNENGGTSKIITITVLAVEPPIEPDPLAEWKFLVGPGGSMDYLLTNVSERTVTFERTAASTATAKMRGEESWTGVIKELETDLKVTRNGVLYFRGRIGPMTDSGDANTQTVEVDAFDYRKKMGTRLLKDEDTMDFVDTDQGTIAWNLINTVQARPNGDDGIRQGLYLTGKVKDFSTEPGTSVEDAIDLLGNATDGFDWEVDPFLKLNLFAIKRGSVKEVTLDFGGAFQKYTRTFGFSTYANVIRATATGGLPPEWVESSDITTRPEGRWERNAAWPDVAAQETHQDNANWLLGESNKRIYTYEITLVPGFWLGKGHFWLGDTVDFQLKHGRLNVVEQRTVETIKVSLDTNGIETVTVTL